MAIEIGESSAGVRTVASREAEAKTALQGPSEAFQGFSSGGFSSSGFKSAAPDRGTKAPRQIFRDDYGWKMTDDQYNNVLEDEKKLKAQIADFTKQGKSQIAKFTKAKGAEIGEYEKKYNSTLADFNAQTKTVQGQIDDGWSKLGSAPSIDNLYDSWWNTDKVPLRVVNGSTVESTTMVPRKVVDSLNTSTFNQGDGSYTANWVDGGKFYNVDVRLRGTDEAYGKELHELVGSIYNTGKDQFVNSEEGRTAYNSTLNQYETAKNDLVKTQQTFNSSLGPVQTQLNNERAALDKARAQMNTEVTLANNKISQETSKVMGSRQAQIDTYASRYADRAAKIKKAYGSIKGDAYGN